MQISHTTDSLCVSRLYRDMSGREYLRPLPGVCGVCAVRELVWRDFMVD